VCLPRGKKKQTALLFGVDRELSETADQGFALRPKRQRRAARAMPVSGSEVLRRSAAAREADRGRETWSLGYGEITAGSFDKLLRYLVQEAPEPLRMRERSSFLDIGSGFGKVL